MAVENQRNRDLFLKAWFMMYIIHVFRALGIKEEIKDILSTEEIVFRNMGRPKIFNNFLDFKVITKSGKTIIFEFKKDSLIKKDFEQLFNYFNPEHCKNPDNTVPMFITISKEGKLSEHKINYLKLCPEIIKTKLINKEKDLKRIRYKFKNNMELTPFECSLLIALPIFETGEKEDEIVEEMCLNIKNKKQCIPDEELSKMIVGMYLNIVEYIDINKQDELMEMINMKEETQGIIAQLENRGFDRGFDKCKQSVLDFLSQSHSVEEIINFLENLEFH